MWYLIITVIVLFIVNWIVRKTFYWETIIQHLWKQIYGRANLMASFLHSSDTKGGENEMIDDFKKQIDFRGNLINSILDYVNCLKKEKDENTEEETFKYGRYDFSKILMLAKANSKAFEKFD